MFAVALVVFEIKINYPLCNFRRCRNCFKKIIPPWNGNPETGISVFTMMINVISNKLLKNSLSNPQMNEPVY